MPADGEIACHRQRHADDAAFGSGVGDLADLAVECCDRGGHDDDTALAFFIRRVGLHCGGRGFCDQQCADEIDFDDLAKEVARHRAFLVDESSCPGDAGAVHGDIDRAHARAVRRPRIVDGGFIRHIDSAGSGPRCRAPVLRLPRRLIDIKQRDLARRPRPALPPPHCRVRTLRP